MFPVDVFRATLNKAIALFNSFQIRFHLTGGITSVYYGEPRMTQDIDIVIDHDRLAGTLESFLKSLETSDFTYNEEAVRRAVAVRGMFQLLDGVESLKLDIYPCELIPGELDRSVNAEVFEGEPIPIASRADSAASKLVWVSKGSHKSRRDLRQIYRAAPDADRKLIDTLAEELQLKLLLDDVLDEPDELA